MKSDVIKPDLLNLLVIILSIYVLIALLIDIFWVLPAETSRVIQLIDNAICFFFLFEFSIRFYKAENKLKFMKWGWIDLISSIPNVEFLRIGRAVRLIRLIRVLRSFRSTRVILNYIFKDKAKGVLTTVLIMVVLLIIFSSISILQFEVHSESNIKTAEDAIWWSYVTITTVGYGDYYPVTIGGRIISAILMTAGVGLFGTLTGYFSSWFLKGRTKKT